MLNMKTESCFKIERKVFCLIAMVLFSLCFISDSIGSNTKRVLNKANEVDEVGNRVKKAESKITNIKFDSEISIERKASATDKWEKTPIGVLATVWLDGKPGGKFKVDVHSEVFEWHDGVTPYLENSYSVSFDGKKGKSAHHHFVHVFGLDDKGKLKKKAEKRQVAVGDVVLGKPTMFKSGFSKIITGKVFCTVYQSEVIGYSFSKLLLNFKDKKSKVAENFQFTQSIREGKEYLEIDSKKTKVKKQTLLDPARGYALLEISEKYDNQVISKMTIVELTEVAKGIWFPTHAILERPTGKPEEPFEKITFKATNVIVNSSDFNETVFDVDFPKKYKIKDIP